MLAVSGYLDNQDRRSIVGRVGDSTQIGRAKGDSAVLQRDWFIECGVKSGRAPGVVWPG